MTMADTIAVMNRGRIEQLGAPQDIYDAPLTAFAANFLGQSNLIPGTVTGRGDQVSVSVFGETVVVPRTRMGTSSDRVIVGVRPEKLHLHRDPAAVPAEHNRLAGTITDVSFVGVSTQYLVVLPWGQELIAFEQNLSVADRPVRGQSVVLSWEPGHTFGLDGGDDLTAGIDRDVREVGAWTAADVVAGTAPAGTAVAG